MITNVSNHQYTSDPKGMMVKFTQNQAALMVKLTDFLHFYRGYSYLTQGLHVMCRLQ